MVKYERSWEFHNEAWCGRTSSIKADKPKFDAWRIDDWADEAPASKYFYDINNGTRLHINDIY